MRVALLLCLALFALLGNAQTYSSVEPIYVNSIIGVNALAVASAGGPAACTGAIFILRNSGTRCFAVASNDTFGVSFEVCPPVLVGANKLSCTATACYALNPTTQKIVVLNNVVSYANITVIATIDIAIVTSPQDFSAYQRNTTFVEILIVDGSNNVWQYTANSPSTTIVTSRSLGITLPAGVPVGIFMNTPNTFMVATAGSTQLSTYTLTGVPGVFGPSFTNIQSISLDGFGNFHVYDTVCGCLKVVSSTGTILTNVTANTPLFISHSRKKILLVDANGIMKYEDAPSFTASATPITCASRNNTITVQISGGDYPLVATLLPEYVVLPMAAPGTVIYRVTTSPIQPETITVLGDSWNRNCYFIPITNIGFDATKVIGFTNATAHSGTTSWAWTFNGLVGDGYTFGTTSNLAVGFSSTMYESVEFWINIGLGNQSFSIFITPTYNMLINPGDLPINTWVPIKINFAKYLVTQAARQNAIGGVRFTSTRVGGTNPIYIDDIILNPYAAKFPDRTLYVFDRCFAMQSLAIPIEYRPFQVYVESTDVSCNADTTTSIPLTQDGTLTVYTVNGTGSVSYNWNYSAAATPNNNTAQTLTGLSAQTSYITVYDNFLNTSFSDGSIGTVGAVVFNSTTYVRSAPYSIAFTPVKDGDALGIRFNQDIYSRDFATLEFWINGGPTGGQTLFINFLKYSGGSNIPTSGGFVTPNTPSGLVSLPRNKWVKVTFPIQTAADFKYNVFVLSTIVSPQSSNQAPTSFAQNTVWIDDIVLLGKDVVSVMDSTGCVVSTPRARVSSPPPLSQIVTVNNVKCNGVPDGSIVVQMAGGVPPYSFSWSGSTETGSIISGVPEGPVNVTARDAKQCNFQLFTANILQPPVLQVTDSLSIPRCHGGLGQVITSIAGGSGTYSFSWTSALGNPRTIPKPAPEPIFIDSPIIPFTLVNAQTVCGGTGSGQTSYSPSHSGYCSMYLNFDLNTPLAGITGCDSCLSISRHARVEFYLLVETQTALTNLAVAFARGSNFTSDVLPIDPLTNFEYVPGTWTKVSLNMTLNFPDEQPDGILFISMDPTNMGNVIVDDLVVLPNVANGAGFLTFAGFQGELEVSATQYFLTVIDSNGCSVSRTYNVTQPDAIEVQFDRTGPSSPAGSDGSVTAHAIGGTPPYSFLWPSGQTTETLTGSTGTYKLIVTDAHGCPVEFTAIIPAYGEIARVREYNSQLSGGLAAIASFGMLICLFSALMLLRYWASFSKLGSFLSFMILLGCVLAFASALVLLPEPTDTLCTLFPWLLGVGFMLVYGCLFVKTWALYQVWRQAVHYHKANLTPGYIMRCLGLAVLVECIFLSIWTAIEPPKAMLVPVINNSLEWQCDVEHQTFWIIFLCVKGVWLIFGVVLSILTRNVVKEYNESSSIAYAIYNNVLLGTIAIPLVVLLKETPGARVVVEVVVITIAFSFTLIVMFFKIWHTIIMPDKIVSGGKIEAATKRTTASSSAGSRSKGSSHSSDGKSTVESP